MSWLAHILGLDNLSGPWYGFWSGVGSDLGEVALFGALWGIIRRHNCDVHRCWRFGILPTVRDGVQHHVCKRHHPTGAPTAQDFIPPSAPTTCADAVPAQQVKSDADRVVRERNNNLVLGWLLSREFGGGS